MKRYARRAFTLVEILIVILFVGLALAILVTSFIQARESSRRKTCISNLKDIALDKYRWAAAQKKTLNTEDIPTWNDLYGEYSTPECLSGGEYTVGDIKTLPKCSIMGHEMPPGYGTFSN